MSADPPRSVAFDRAASFYDTSRETESEETRREAELVASELVGRDDVLEIGTGTGAIGLRLCEAGLRLTAIDLSMPMLGRLVERAGGYARFPLVQADATRMPFVDGAFDAAFARWVLHLIPNWPDALVEVARVVRRGGVFLVNIGGAVAGPESDVRARLAAEIGRELRPAGLMWHDYESLDAAAGRFGMRPRQLPPMHVEREESLGDYLRGIEQNQYSWLWPVPDEARLAALAVVRPWAEDRFGPLDRPMPVAFDIVWRAFDLPAG
ncbi:MAG TPA: class I SAM-dependent methyltransferase [Actinomycetota bacterium]|jgi:SAM-dependent methyltransferase|nr:class I SAM-dependent methyltransferase [Actinomycetota bacterium]